MRPEKGSGSSGDAGRELVTPAANDDKIEGAGPGPGWDPFEVWRTRVRDERNRRQDVEAPRKET